MEEASATLVQEAVQGNREVIRAVIEICISEGAPLSGQELFWNQTPIESLVDLCVELLDRTAREATEDLSDYHIVHLFYLLKRLCKEAVKHDYLEKKVLQRCFGILSTDPPADMTIPGWHEALVEQAIKHDQCRDLVDALFRACNKIDHDSVREGIGDVLVELAGHPLFADDVERALPLNIDAGLIERIHDVLDAPMHIANSSEELTLDQRERFETLVHLTLESIHFGVKEESIYRLRHRPSAVPDRERILQRADAILGTLAEQNPSGLVSALQEKDCQERMQSLRTSIPEVNRILNKIEASLPDPMGMELTDVQEQLLWLFIRLLEQIDPQLIGRGLTTESCTEQHERSNKEWDLCKGLFQENLTGLRNAIVQIRSGSFRRIIPLDDGESIDEDVADAIDILVVCIEYD
ncbi:MAG: hypothetical protein AAB853_04525 [Patescibacteria group bacterium]